MNKKILTICSILLFALALLAACSTTNIPGAHRNEKTSMVTATTTPDFNLSLTAAAQDGTEIALTEDAGIRTPEPTPDCTMMFDQVSGDQQDEWLSACRRVLQKTQEAAQRSRPTDELLELTALPGGFEVKSLSGHPSGVGHLVYFPRWDALPAGWSYIGDIASTLELTLDNTITLKFHHDKNEGVFLETSDTSWRNPVNKGRVWYVKFTYKGVLWELSCAYTGNSGWNIEFNKDGIGQ